MLQALPLALTVALAGAAGAAEAEQPPTTFRDEYLVELDWAAERLEGLAEAIPADRYDWCPAEGIRSVAELGRALAHARGVVEDITPEGLDREVELFGRTTTARGVLLRMLVHANEHEGQLVAYARSIGVTPPWSRSE